MDDKDLQLVLEKQRKRYAVLRKMYEIVGDNTREHIPDDMMVEELEMTHEELSVIQHYLAEERLINYATFGNTSISHWGIKEMEDSITHPDRSTEHFASVVIQNFYGSVYGGVQGGGEHNTQTVLISSEEEKNEAQ